MAILKNLIVNGSSRFLNTAYFQDVSIAGSANFASISASGNITAGGNLYSTTGNLYLKNLLAIKGSVDTWLRINDANAFTSGTYFGQNIVRTDGTFQVGANGSAVNIYYQNGNSNKAMTVSIPATFNGATTTISNLAAPIATINNATISGDLTVNGVLHSNEFIKNIVKAVGGQLYVSPTFQATNSTTVTCTNADESYVYLTLQDDGITSSEYAGATWYSGSKIMLSGTLTANTTGHTEEIVFSSAPGELTAQMNSGTDGAKKLQIKVEHDNASTYFKAGNLTFSDVAVMMYQLKNGSNYFPIGIYIKAYGTDNQKSYIDIFGGSDTTPNARLGLLTGLGSMPSGSTIQGWGIYTDNGFFKGIIEANGGLIGNWTIGESSMYYSSDTPSDSSIVLAPGGKTASVNIGGSGTAQKSWVFTVKNLFGVDTSGALYSSSGKIGGWNISASSIYSGSHIAYNTANNGIYIGQDYIAMGSGGVTYFNTSGTGKIGPWTLSTTYFRNGNIASATNTSVAGVYLGTDGLNISNGTAATTSYITKTAVNIGNKLTWDGSTLSVNGAITATSLTLGTGVTIAQSQVDGLTTTLNGKASTSSVADAAKTATNYISTIGSTGINVSYATNANNYLQITGDGVSIYKDINGTSTQIANYASSITLGQIANGVTRVQIDNDSLDVISRDNNGTDATVATFGQTARIGSISGRNITINENGLTFNNNNSRGFYIGVDSRATNKSFLSETIVFNKSSGSTVQDNKTYYLLTNVPTGRTVTEVGWLYLDEGDEVLHAADDFHIDDWIINNDKLWINPSPEDADYYDGTYFNYIYSATDSSTDPYCVIGLSGYSSTNIPGSMSFAQGKDCLAIGLASTAVGYSTSASGIASFSCGNQSEAQSDYSFAGGFMSTASGDSSFAYGYKTIASGERSIAMGINSAASGDCSISIGYLTTASGECSTAMGMGSRASGVHSTAIGNNAVNASGNYSTAIGLNNLAYGNYSTAIGCSSYAYSDYSVAVGNSTMAYAARSVAIGNSTTASGLFSTAIGYNTTASGSYSTTMGVYTIANKSSQTAIGMYNVEDTTPSSAVHPDGTKYGNYAFIIGNGTDNDNRSNALTVDWAGNVEANKFIGNQKVLWSGGSSGRYMTDDTSQRIDLSEPVSTQANGLVLVWSRYNPSTSTAYDDNFHIQFVPKWFVANWPGKGETFVIADHNYSGLATKYVYVYDTYINGNANNTKTGTANGVTYANNRYVLRRVIGV